MWGYRYRFISRAGYPYGWSTPVAPVPDYGFGIGRSRGIWGRGRGRGRGFWCRGMNVIPSVWTTPVYPAYYGTPYVVW